eukprot:TRINITY_DN3200_c0_g1_i1.p1 TRINITY_DN3200_c0_g1~~TRINITY_DN3200_c0_g1_i1.p1  ORF type:complete len:343 (-),score=47.85 TRINITY_DN3200_c0_g1_i1:275-1303(-)
MKGSVESGSTDNSKSDDGRIANNQPPNNNKKTMFANYWNGSGYFVSGAVAGAVSRTATSPFERIKILNQVQDIVSFQGEQRYVGVLNSLKTIYKDEGVYGYFKGNGTNVIRIVPTSAIRFYSFETYKEILLKRQQDKEGKINTLNTGGKFIAGGLAGSTAVIGTYPLEFVRTKLSLPDTSLKYSGVIDCLAKVYRQHGIIGWYSGVVPAILGVAPSAAINFTTYETLKELTQKYIAHKPPLLSATIFGAISGTVAMTLLYPLDLIKRRTIVSPNFYKSTFHAFGKIVLTEGVAALYKGIIPAYFKVVPTVSISFFVYEFCLETFFPNIEAQKRSNSGPSISL